ncbi:MAG: flagellin [Myxococcota bacterium]|nr:flagellin [Myxococcota bacterium]
MSLTLNSDNLTLGVRRHLEANQNRMAQVTERLSSGLRVNSAKDDAARMAIASKNGAHIRSMHQVKRGIADGMSYIQVADGGLSEIGQILERMRELVVQASTGTLADSDRLAIHGEVTQLKLEVQRIAETTTIFGQHPLLESINLEQMNGPGGFENGVEKTTQQSGIVTYARVPAGTSNFSFDIDSKSVDDDIQLFTRSGQHLAGTGFSVPFDPQGDADIVWTAGANNITPGNVDSAFITEANGYFAAAQYDAAELLSPSSTDGSAYDETLSNGLAVNETEYNNMAIKYSGDQNNNELDGAPTPEVNRGNVSGTTTERIEIDYVTEDLLISVIGAGNFDATASWGSMPEPLPPEDDLSILTDITADAGTTIDVAHKDASAAGLSLGAVSTKTLEKAQVSIEKVENAIALVAQHRTYFGAKMKGLEAQSNVISTRIENATAMQSRLVDADVAAETVELSKVNILMQAGMSVLAQANQVPSLLMRLLEG